MSNLDRYGQITLMLNGIIISDKKYEELIIEHESLYRKLQNAEILQNEIKEMKNDIKILKADQYLIKRIRTKTIVDEIKQRLMKVKLIYKNTDSVFKTEQGYDYKQVHKLLDKIIDDFPLQSISSVEGNENE